MKEGENLKWSGLDLSPLIYESTITPLWRFQWRNSLTWLQLKKLFACVQYNSNKIDFERFLSGTRWQMDNLENMEIKQGLLTDRSVWIEEKFRFCPQCLGHGYHSFWFQLVTLQNCPIHCTSLSTQCYNCGASTPKCQSHISLFKKPFVCVHCKSAIGRTLPTLAAHIEFRQHIDEHIEKFRPIVETWKAICENRKVTADMYRYQRKNCTWCDPDEFERSLACCGLHLPQHFAQPAYNNITILAWITVINQDVNAEYFDFSPENQSKDWNRPSTAYHNLLWRLENWLIQHDKVLQLEFERHLKFRMDFNNLNASIDLTRYNTRIPYQ